MLVGILSYFWRNALPPPRPLAQHLGPGLAGMLADIPGGSEANDRIQSTLEVGFLQLQVGDD